MSVHARSNLDDIWRHIVQETSREAADRQIATLKKRFAMLAEHPELGSLRPEMGRQVRGIAVAPYVVYYKEAPDGVLIERVLHGRRDQRTGWRDRDSLKRDQWSVHETGPAYGNRSA